MRTARLRAVRTLVISDLHLGASTRADLLRRAELREPLVEAARGVDRVVILGDGIELRDGPQRDAVGIAGPLYEDLGRALGRDGELLMLAGNHDHGLVAGWIDGRLLTEPSGFLELEQHIEPRDAGPLAARLAELAAPARVRVAYPGVWLRDDVFAIHGHYSDLHATVPTFERLAAGAMARWVVKLPEDGARPDDYEAALAPLYAWMHALTQRSDHAVVSAGAGASARAWVAMGGRGRRLRPVRTTLLGGGFRVAVAAINALGIGPVDADLSGAGLRRGYLRGIREVIHRLGVRAPHVVWGHSHRSGPWPGDDLAEWTTATGGRIHNTGSWVYQPHFLSDAPNGSPYWPGTAVLIEESGPPELVRLLGDRGHRELAPPA
ncbi:MAG TPA: metallophosphoesterase [Solirubrobacteraceae bacterium]|nr:metallophosphoesterase [Solirubrobacteraceae bacterium]